MGAALCWAENILVRGWKFDPQPLFFFFPFSQLCTSHPGVKKKKKKKMITLTAKTCGKRMTQFRRSARQQVKANRYRLGVSTFHLQLFVLSRFD